jgi:hypothetical protein
MEPEFPKFSDGSKGTINFTSNYVYGSGMPTFDVNIIVHKNVVLKNLASEIIPSI